MTHCTLENSKHESQKAWNETGLGAKLQSLHDSHADTEPMASPKTVWYNNQIFSQQLYQLPS